MSIDHGSQVGSVTINRTRQPSLELAQSAQTIGYAAWHEQFSHRPNGHVRNVFDPGNRKSAKQLLAKMQSKTGKFVGAVAVHEDMEVGYAWTADDVGKGEPLTQLFKTFFGRLVSQKPYAWNAQINVLPEWQHRGVGSVLLRAVLAPFDSDQRVSAYVFDENQSSLEWFKNRGFSPRPDVPSDPNGRLTGPDMYFGAGADHVSQWRLEAPSVAAVLKIIDSQSDLFAYRVKDTEP